ncbi:ribonuclease BN [Oscillochloris trichoides DG-6]|uniref:Ribonuclease BN n=1 Tax=Oscillochloris trichoides DG-6 TaxID=765420 RepID=E1IBR3_9CHLR|nr:ribonuclease BN [Oscillochloris trichoides DG-6]
MSLGASLAYYALFSLFPLILVILSIVGAVLDPQQFAVQQRILSLIGSEQVRGLITQTLQNLNSSSVGAGLIGFITLLMGASGIFGALEKAFAAIWETGAEESAGGILQTILKAVQQKLLAFGLVLGSAFLMLLSIISTVLVTALSKLTTTLPGQALFWQVVQFSLSLALLSLAFATIFKFIPRCKVLWRDVWLAALISALLFTGLQKVVGIYLGQANYASYGVVGSVMALMFWIYLSSLVILLGGVLSFVYARHGRSATVES